MFDAELLETQQLVCDVNKAIAEYYDNQHSSNKIDFLETAIAKLSLLLTFLVQFRYLILTQYGMVTPSQKIAMNNLLNELKVQQDAFKSISYNLTAILYVFRDKTSNEAAIR